MKNISLAKTKQGIDSVVDFWKSEFGLSITRGYLTNEAKNYVRKELSMDTWVTTNEKNRKKEFILSVFEQKLNALPLWMAKERVLLVNCRDNILKIIEFYQG